MKFLHHLLGSVPNTRGVFFVFFASGEHLYISGTLQYLIIMSLFFWFFTHFSFTMRFEYCSWLYSNFDNILKRLIVQP